MMNPGTGAVALNAPALGSAYNQAALTNRLGIATRERGHEVVGEDIAGRKAIRQDLVKAQKLKGQDYVGKLAEERESARKQLLDKQALEVEGQQAAQANALKNRELQAERQAENKANRLTREENAQAQANEGVKLGNETQETVNSTKEANATARTAKYEREHGGRTPAQVAEGRREKQEEVKGSPQEKREKREEAKGALSSAHSTYALFKGSKEFQSHTPEEQRAILEEALAKRGVEAPVAKWAVNKLWQSVGVTNAATGLAGGL